MNTNLEYIVETNQLSKKYRNRTVVDGLTFKIKPGQTLGPWSQRRWKTTTIRMLMGLTGPSSGSAAIFGLNLATQIKQIRSRIRVVLKPNYSRTFPAMKISVFCRLYNQPFH